MKLTEISLQNRTTVFVGMFMLLVVGTFCYTVLPREAVPDIKIPFIVVTTSYEGVAPSDMETLVTMKIEKEVKGIKDVKEIRSTSVEGFSVITVEFQPNVNTDDALQKVRDKVNVAKAEIPEEADEPGVTEISFADFPILLVNLSGGDDQVRLRQIADDLQDMIEAIPGVLKANMTGGLEREIRLEFDPDRLAAYNVSPLEAAEAVRQNNMNIPSGSLELGEANYVVKVPGEFKDPDEINNIVIATPNGKPVYLLDVARVVDGYKEPTSYSRLNGEPAVTLSIQKRSGENMIRITDEIKSLLERAKSQLPEGVKASYTADQSKTIRMMVAELENSLLSGLVLILLIITVSLSIRDSLMISLAIPFSMLISFAVLYGLHITLNMVVLFSLTLSLGMLVDDAIVIVENIHRHHRAGLSRFEAVRSATKEIGWPVVTSTLTTIGAFLPLMFWPGIMGDFLSYLPKTVIITLSASLLVALVLNPCLATVVLKNNDHGPKPVLGDSRFIAWYKRFLRGAIEHRWSTLVFALGSFVVMLLWFSATGLGTEFFPRADPDRAVVNVKLPEGSSLDTSDRIVRAVEAAAAKYSENKTIVASVGGGLTSGGEFTGGGAGSANKSNVSIEFVDREFRKTPSSKIIDHLRKDLANLSGAEITAEEERHGPQTGKPITIEISGEDFEAVGALAAGVRGQLKKIDGVVDIKDDYVMGKPELRVRIDKEKAALLALNTNIIGQMIKTSIAGSKAGVYRVGNDEYDVVVRLPKSLRSEVDTLSQLRIPNTQGQQIPLSSVATFEWSSGLASIQRVDQKRTVSVTADAAKGYNANALLAKAKDIMKRYPVPAGFSVRFTGQNKDQMEAQAFLGKAFIAALFLVALILVTEFDSLILPLVIMTTVLLSLTGVLLGLILTHTPFGIIMTGIGVISLAGVVVKNGIVLIDYTEKLRDRGLDMLDAVVTAGAVRLRPVLLTALTAILGVVPTALGVTFDFHKLRFDVGSTSTQIWRPIAIATIFGLGLATMLTLVVVPSLYVILAPLRGARRHGASAADAKWPVESSAHAGSALPSVASEKA